MKTMGFVIVGFLTGILIGLTYLNYRKQKKKPPQDHYYAERKKND